jgi:hypothetical protein
VVGNLGGAHEKKLHSGNALEMAVGLLRYWGERTRGSHTVEMQGKAGDSSGGTGANVQEEAT